MLLANSVSLDGWEVVLRLAIAAGLGAAVGVEREVREHEAGVRTHLLVALGSALFTVVGAYGFEDFGNATDPTRVAAQIVTGIGFLGAGAILREGLSVRGLTTAGSLWVVAAIGMGAGAGYYWAAIAGTALTIFALWPLRLVTSETIDRVRPEDRRLVVELEADRGPGQVLELLGDRCKHLEVWKDGDRRKVSAEVEDADESLVRSLSELESVAGVRWRR
jgi:putative Mg2+ transporter-C (MgtC) family protein